MRVLGLIFILSFFLISCSNMKVKETHAPEVVSGADAEQKYQFSPAPKELPSYRVTDPEPPQITDKELEYVPPEMQPKVEQWIAYFQGKGRPHMERYLERSTRYIQLMKIIFKQNGLPEDLVYVALIESGFSSRATSRAAAVGYWQFIKPTGRRYGLEINSFVDERRDPVLSTQAAAEYFKGLYSVFGSWYLSMASYNVGENRVKREVMNHYTRDFWELARKRRFPRETTNYVPKYIAARLIARNPEKYGFSEIEYEKPLEFELVKLDKPINLKTLTTKMGLDYEEMKMLNPKFRGEVAPVKQGGLEIRVPVGQVQMALAAAQESFVTKIEFVADAGETETYRVRPGDSLFSISKKYHTTVSWLRDVNDLKSGKKLRIGMRLQVPDRSARKSTKSNKKTTTASAVIPDSSASVATSATASAETAVSTSTASVDKSENVAIANEAAGSNPEVVTSKGVFYVVQPGDTLSTIAEEYDLTVSKLRKLNKLGKGSMIRVGMRLKVPKDEEIPKVLEGSGNSEGVSHIVKSGENLTSIAKQYGVTVQEILEANNLKKKSKINMGKTLIIPVKAQSAPNTSVESKIKNKNASKRKIASLQIKKIKMKKTIAKVKIHVVKKGENLSHIASKYQVSLNQLKAKNQLSHRNKLFVGAKLMIPVADASVSQ